jgi:hypothetical protein
MPSSLLVRPYEVTGKVMVAPLLNEAPYQEHTGFLTLILKKSGQLHAMQSLEATPPAPPQPRG